MCQDRGIQGWILVAKNTGIYVGMASTRYLTPHDQYGTGHEEAILGSCYLALTACCAASSVETFILASSKVTVCVDLLTY